ncbi:MAG: amidohydrolase [Candidatus Limiplasma sp.]|nr:amidohydrolase [Candidatus Limiplasma sp.]
MDIRQLAAGQRDYILHTRRHLHSHPELSWQEVATTAFITRELTALGIPVMPILGSTGLVGVLRGEAPVQRGRTLMLRADIDALPIQERTGLPYASENPGVMHACGHDTHTAMLLGAARILHSLRAELAGEVRFLFQPAEEVNAGAEHCIRQGVLDGVDAIFGMHIWGDLDSPYFSIEQGSRMASCDNFTLTVHGTAAHGSAPHQGVDAIVAAAAVVTAAQTIVSRAVDPHVPLVLTFGEIHGGKRFNIIADEVTLVGTVRTHDPALRAQGEMQIRCVAEHTAAAYGAT